MIRTPPVTAAHSKVRVRARSSARRCRTGSVTTVLPGPSSRATSSAIFTDAPAEMPTSSPSRRASASLVRCASRLGDGAHLGDHRAVEDRGHEAGADAVDAVLARLAARQHGAASRARRRRCARPGTCARSTWPTPVIVPPVPDAVHERVAATRVAELRQDLRRGGAAVRLGVGRVLELLGHEGVRVLRATSSIAALDRALHDLRRGREVQLGAVGLEQRAPLERHVVRHGQDQPVALGRAHQRQPDAGVARGRLDDHRLARAHPPLALGRLDHRQRDAILERAARVELLALAEHVGHRRRRRRWRSRTSGVPPMSSSMLSTAMAGIGSGLP